MDFSFSSICAEQHKVNNKQAFATSIPVEILLQAKVFPEVWVKLFYGNSLSSGRMCRSSGEMVSTADFCLAFPGGVCAFCFGDAWCS